MIKDMGLQTFPKTDIDDANGFGCEISLGFCTPKII